MNSVYFEKILIADIYQKKAKLATFTKGINVISSNENHVGKSSLIKSLYYSLGADIDYDNTWDKNTKLYILDFSINDKKYTIARFEKKFLLFDNINLIAFCKNVTKELSPKLEKIFGFAVYLPNKITKKHELAPPVFTYLPYYIDQDKGWGTEPYESFSNLNQYAKTSRIKSLYYHLQVYNKVSVDLQAQMDNGKHRITEIDSEIAKLETTLETLLSETKNIISAETMLQLENNLALPKEKIDRLMNEIGASRNRIQTLQSTLSHHQYQLSIIVEYKKIHKSASPNKVNNKLTSCPRCGYAFDEDLYQFIREQYNEQNEGFMIQQIQYIIKETIEEFEREKGNYVDLMKKLQQEEQLISLQQENYEVYIKQRGLDSSINSLKTQLSNMVLEKESLESNIKNIRKELKDLPQKKEIDNKYISDTRSNIIKLDAWNREYEEKIGLMKPLKGQGTLASKIILAQYVALFSTMQSFAIDNLRFPFVVDSPRSKEPSKKSSEEILNLILGIKSLPQIILATMDFSEFDTIEKENINLLELHSNKALLNHDEYVSNNEYIENILGMFKSFTN